MVAGEPRVSVSTEVIEWAILRAGKDRDTLSGRFTWLNQTALDNVFSVTMPQLMLFAKTTYTPYGYFFLDEPPEEPLPLPDFRTVRSELMQRPSANLLDTIYQAQMRQAWYHDYRRRWGEDPVPVVGSGAGKTVAAVAGMMTLALGVGLGARRSFRTPGDLLREVLDSIEGLGVLVQVSGVVGNDTHRRLAVEEFRGFALSDDLAPVIFVNGQDSLAAKVFTVLHELAHLYAGQSALSDAPLGREPGAGELWCNQVAAEVLVPADDLRTRFRGDLAVASIDALARFYGVSTLVVLNQLFNTQLLSWDVFRPRYVDEVGRANGHLSASLRKPGGDFYKTQGRRFGKDFRRAVVADTVAGNTQFTEAARLLGTSNLDTVMSTAGQSGDL